VGRPLESWMTCTLHAHDRHARGPTTTAPRAQLASQEIVRSGHRGRRVRLGVAGGGRVTPTRVHSCAGALAQAVGVHALQLALLRATDRDSAHRQRSRCPPRAHGPPGQSPSAAGDHRQQHAQQHNNTTQHSNTRPRAQVSGGSSAGAEFECRDSTSYEGEGQAASAPARGLCAAGVPWPRSTLLRPGCSCASPAMERP
jgi:hypothetical protein